MDNKKIGTVVGKKLGGLACLSTRNRTLHVKLTDEEQKDLDVKGCVVNVNGLICHMEEPRKKEIRMRLKAKLERKKHEKANSMTETKEGEDNP